MTSSRDIRYGQVILLTCFRLGPIKIIQLRTWEGAPILYSAHSTIQYHQKILEGFRNLKNGFIIIWQIPAKLVFVLFFKFLQILDRLEIRDKNKCLIKIKIIINRCKQWFKGNVNKLKHHKRKKKEKKRKLFHQRFCPIIFFLFNTNNLHSVGWFKVFVADTNNYNISIYYLTLIIIISSHMITWFQVTNNDNS